MASVARLEPRPQSASLLHSPTVWVDAWWRCSDQTALLVPRRRRKSPKSDKEESMSVAAVQTRHIDPSVAGDIANGPIVAAVDGSPASRVAIDTAIRLGRELGSPLTFVYVRRGPRASGKPDLPASLDERVGPCTARPQPGVELGRARRHHGRSRNPRRQAAAADSRAPVTAERPTSSSAHAAEGFAAVFRPALPARLSGQSSSADDRAGSR